MILLICGKNQYIKDGKAEMRQNGECLCTDLVTRYQDNIPGKWISRSNFRDCALPKQFQSQCRDRVIASNKAVFGPFRGCIPQCVPGQVSAMALWQFCVRQEGPTSGDIPVNMVLE